MLYNWYSSLSGLQLLMSALGAVILGIAISTIRATSRKTAEPGLPEGEGSLYIKLPKNSEPPEIRPVAFQTNLNRFTQYAPELTPAEPALKLFGRGSVGLVTNIIKDISAMPGALYFNYDYFNVAPRSANDRQFTIGFYKLEGRGLPVFELRPEGWPDRLGNVFDGKDINPAWDQEFSRKYYLSGPDRQAVEELFTSDLMAAFDRLEGAWYAQGGHDCLIVFKQGFLFPRDYTRFMAGAASIFRAIAGK